MRKATPALVVLVSVNCKSVFRPINLRLLAYFKYAGFFVGSLNGIGRALGLPVELPALHMLLPIGISFYTFNSMSYTVDVFRRQAEPTPLITRPPVRVRLG